MRNDNSKRPVDPILAAFPVDVIDHLRQVTEVVTSVNREARKSVPHFVLTGDRKMAEAFAREYESMLVEHKVFTREYIKKSFIKLSFPGDGEPEYFIHRFFDAPRLAASTRNRFCGVELVDLTTWKDVNPAVSPHFAKLLAFVKDSAQVTTRFVFVLAEGTRYRAVFEKLLSDCVTVRSAALPLPKEEAAIKYVVEKLKKRNVFCSGKLEGKSGLAVLVKTVTEKPSYVGYESLDRVIDELAYEWGGTASRKKVPEELLRRNNSGEEEMSVNRIGFL